MKGTMLRPFTPCGNGGKAGRGMGHVVSFMGRSETKPWALAANGWIIHPTSLCLRQRRGMSEQTLSRTGHTGRAKRIKGESLKEGRLTSGSRGMIYLFDFDRDWLQQRVGKCNGGKDGGQWARLCPQTLARGPVLPLDEAGGQRRAGYTRSIPQGQVALTFLWLALPTVTRHSWSGVLVFTHDRVQTGNRQ